VLQGETSPELVNFARGTYRQRSPWTSQVLRQLFESFQGEGLVMPYTVEDFERDYLKKHFARLRPEERQEILRSLSPQEQCEALERLPPERLQEVLELLAVQERRRVLASLPPEEQQELLQALLPEKQRELLKALPLEQRLAGLSEEQIRQYLEQLTAHRPAEPPKPRPKKRSRNPRRP